MSREIKFRAFQDGQILEMKSRGNYSVTRFFGLLYEDAPVMQFTGLTDSKGTPIYEGDIMRHPEFVAGGPVVVKYSVDAASFTLNGWDGFKTDFTEGTVIGNIHQHKHLLEE